MSTFSGPEDLQGARFVDVSLHGARFVRTDLGDVVMRAVDVAGADIDAPWLLDGESTFVVNGVDVAPLVEAELNLRFPGRGERRARTPEGLRSAWAALEATWAVTIERASRLPEGDVDVSVDDEWSFAQTLRHLVMAIDTWLLGAVLGLGQEERYHPIGQPNAEYYTDGYDPAVFADGVPAYADVLAVRAERFAMVRDYLAGVTDDVLAETRPHPWAPEHPENVLACLHTILEEGWEHHRYAVRDLDVLERR